METPKTPKDPGVAEIVSLMEDLESRLADVKRYYEERDRSTSHAHLENPETPTWKQLHRLYGYFRFETEAANAAWGVVLRTLSQKFPKEEIYEPSRKLLNRWAFEAEANIQTLAPEHEDF